MTSESNFALSERDWRLVEKILLRPLTDAGARVWIFGSRARGDSLAFSDLDVLIEGYDDRSELSRIGEALEESALSVKVDLVLSPDLAESYRAGVLRDRVRLVPTRAS